MFELITSPRRAPLLILSPNPPDYDSPFPFSFGLLVDTLQICLDVLRRH